MDDSLPMLPHGFCTAIVGEQQGGFGWYYCQDPCSLIQRFCESHLIPGEVGCDISYHFVFWRAHQFYDSERLTWKSLKFTYNLYDSPKEGK